MLFRSVELKGHWLGVEVLAMAPGGKTFVSGGIDSTLRVWNTADIEKHAVLSGHSGAIVAAVMDADRGYVFSAGSDGKIIRWNLKTDLPDPGPDHFRTGDSSSVLALAASRDSSLLVSSGIDGALKIWDAASGECRRSFERRLVTPGSFAVSPDASKMAMIGRDGHIYMYDARKDEERLLKISGDGELFIELLAFRSSGKELVACARSGLIGVYDPYDGKALGTVKPAGGYINSMAIFAGERRLLTHNGDNTLRLYEFESGGPGSEVKIVPLQIIPFTMRLTAFAASGDMIAAGDGAGYVRFFKIKVL